MLAVEVKTEVPYRDVQWLTLKKYLHRYCSPAYTRWHYSGQKYIEEYRINGRRHRESVKGPSVRIWYKNGQKRYVQYWADGVRHRNPLEGPSTTYWYDDGQKCSKEFRVEGVLESTEDYPC